MNVTVVQSTAQSNLRLYPADAASEPVVSNLNWLAGDSATANKVDVKLSSTGQVKVAVANGTVNVLGDVVGYYTNTTLKALEAGLVTKANAADVYTKAEIDSKLAGKIDDAKVLWAIINSNGTLAQGKGVLSASQGLTGIYSVTFNRDISACAGVATPADTTATGSVDAKEATLNQLLADPTSVSVETSLSVGTLDASAFTVVVICP